MNWEVVIGLEIHAQLATDSKIFSGASTAYGSEPNTQACAVDLGLPGVLPVLNAAAVTMAVKFGLAIGAEISPRSIFARKNYFYPDLPKGYQISQYELPIVQGGTIDIQVDDAGKRINLTRAHLEEDAGKSLHEEFPDQTGVDLNRAGTPLLEIVSEPELRSAKEAVAYARAVHTLVRYLGICDGNMQEGSFRCDANVSIRRPGDPLGTRNEIKNLNSFRFLEEAIEYEIERQADVLESGGTIVQQTRLYDSDKKETRPMRDKEDANDYRYFPDPDLLPVELDDAFIEPIRAALPELPQAKKQRFIDGLGLSAYNAQLLSSSRDTADYFELALAASGGEAKLTANWIMGELTGAMNRDNLEIIESPIPAEELGILVKRIADNTISGKIAKDVFDVMWTSDEKVDEIIEARGLKQVTDTGELDTIIETVVTANPDQVKQYLNGKTKVLGFLVGQVMKSTDGKANPKAVNELLIARLKSD